jgi:hypothetical protein
MVQLWGISGVVGAQDFTAEKCRPKKKKRQLRCRFSIGH